MLGKGYTSFRFSLGSQCRPQFLLYDIEILEMDQISLGVNVNMGYEQFDSLEICRLVLLFFYWKVQVQLIIKKLLFLIGWKFRFLLLFVWDWLMGLVTQWRAPVEWYVGIDMSPQGIWFALSSVLLLPQLSPW